MPPGLSKSRFTTGLQCEKALYLTVHSPELASEVSEGQQMIFDQGHAVGIEAQERFPGGVLIDAPHTDHRLALDQTQSAIEAGALTLYEATFQHDGVLVKADILTRSRVGSAWDLVEVKSTASVKPAHIPDAAIQLWVLREAGVPVQSASILHIDTACIHPELDDLFSRVDVTPQTEALQAEIPSIVDRFRRMLQGSAPPDVDIGPHCQDPYECKFKAHCWAAKNVPAVSVFNVPKLTTEKKWDRYRRGDAQLSRLNAGDFSPIQKRMIECSVRNIRFVDAAAIGQRIAEWNYPMAFLDFETIGFAIPRIPGTHPFEQLPFQFSCHIQRQPGATVEHAEYLHTDGSDPREHVARSLTKSVPDAGSVVAYNMAFERGVLSDLAEAVPEHRTVLLNIARRLVDPLPLFRAYVYDPGFKGSFSIKAVAPAILGHAASYEGMEVGEGSQAQTAFLEMIHPDTPARRREEVARALLEYCRKDTEGMMKLVFWLQSQATPV